MAMDRLFYSKKDRENVAVHRVLCMYNNLAYIYSRVCVSMRRTTILNSKRAGDMAKVSFSIWLKVSSMLLKHGGNVESRSWFVIKNWSIHRMESASIFFFFFFSPFYICITVVYALFIEYRWWNIVFACYIRMRFFCFIHPLEQRRPCYILMLVDHL